VVRERGTHEGEEKVYKVLVGKPKENKPLGRLRRRWEDGIKIDLRVIGWGGVEWIQLAWYSDRWWALVNTVFLHHRIS
jgi:hypothetical protein